MPIFPAEPRPPQDGVRFATSALTLGFVIAEVNHGTICSSALDVLHRSIPAGKRPLFESERNQNALVKVYSELVSGETFLCAAQQVVD